MRTQRVVIKVGSSSLTNETGRISIEKMASLVAQIAKLVNQGNQVVLVSSGAVAAGLGKLGWQRSRITIPEKQAASAIGQGLLIETYAYLFGYHNLTIGQLLLTRSDVEDRRRFLHIRNTIETMLQHGIIPIVNENDTVAVEEIRFGDNDTLSSLVALVSSAQLLILLTDINGLYTANPRTHVGAQHIPHVYTITEDMMRSAEGQGSEVGTGGMRTKLAAANIATQSGIDTIIAASHEQNILPTILDEGTNHDVHYTRFHAVEDPIPAKKSWLVHGGKVDGQIQIDAGAVQALTQKSKSLLLPGITGVAGDFHEGAVVRVVTAEEREVARGITYFSAWDLRLLLDRKVAGEKLSNLHEVIHRNDLVIT